MRSLGFRALALGAAVHLVGLPAVSSVALAGSGRPARAAAAAEGSSSKEPSPQEEAYALFEESETSYKEGRFAEAADLLKAAYALDPEPTLLFNLGRALEGAGNLEGAAAAYREYLEAAPKAENRQQTERRIENIDKQLADRRALEQARNEEAERRAELERTAKAQAERAAEVKTSPATDANDPRDLAWLTVGLGGAAVGAGAVLGVLALRANEKALQDPINLTAAGQVDDARALALGANLALAAGGAAVIGGLLWLLLDGPSRAEPHVSLEVGASSLAVGGTF